MLESGSLLLKLPPALSSQESNTIKHSSEEGILSQLNNRVSMNQTIHSTTSWFVTTPAARRSAQTYRYRLETEPTKAGSEEGNTKVLDACVAQPDNLELLETIVVLALPGYKLRRYWVPEDSCVF
jgi:hypothetical protein